MLSATRRLILSIGAATLLAAATWCLLSATSGSPVQLPNDPAKDVGAGPLDGKTFVGKVGPVGGKPDVKDVWGFFDGMFVSRECERRCQYPARPYFARNAAGETEFVSETRCPYKDATLIWRGTVAGDVIKGVMTWTVSRWYWTIEKQFAFEGRRVTQTPSLARN